jgi:hypothetical protein
MRFTVARDPVIASQPRRIVWPQLLAPKSVTSILRAFLLENFGEQKLGRCRPVRLPEFDGQTA